MTLAQVHFRVPAEEKKAFDDTFEALGMNSTEAYKLFMRKAIEAGTLPFELGVPNARLQKSLKSNDYLGFNTDEEGLNYLND